jgi:GT2 family glycosyltransferase
MVRIIIPSLGKKHILGCFDSLKHIPFDYQVDLVMEGNSWPQAINIGLSRSQGDVILMDDDARILPDTFKNWYEYYPKADIFGFKLLFDNGLIQHAGAKVVDGQIEHIGYQQPASSCSKPYYPCHVTTSLIYIKRKALDELQGMSTDYPGDQFEDVDFCFRAIQAGLKILYVPNPAIHLESATKRTLADFPAKMALNYAELKRRFFTPKLLPILASFPHDY